MEPKSRLWHFSGDEKSYRHFLECMILDAYELYPNAFPGPHEHPLPLTIRRSDIEFDDSAKAQSQTKNTDELQIEVWNPTKLLAQASTECSDSRGSRHCSRKWASVIRRIPKNEEEWQSTRKAYGLDHVEHIEFYLAVIQQRSWHQAAGIIAECSLANLGTYAATLHEQATQLRGLSNLVSFLFIAACLVEEKVTQSSEQADEALKKYFRAVNSRVRQDEKDWLRRFKTGATRIIHMVDDIYDKIGDSAFELVIYMCLTPSVIERVSMHDMHYTVSLFPDANKANHTGIASSSFYIVYLLTLWRPDLSVKVIGNALGSSLSGRLQLPVRTLDKRRQDNSSDITNPDDLDRSGDRIRDEMHPRCIPDVSTDFCHGDLHQLAVLQPFPTAQNRWINSLSTQQPYITPQHQSSHYESHSTYEEHDHVYLAKLLVSVGGTVDAVFLQRLQNERATCRYDGELVHTGSFSEWPLSADPCRMENAVQSLQQRQLLLQHGRSYRVEPVYQQELNREITNSVTWKVMALKAVLYSFPEHYDTEPINYISICHALLPNLEIALAYLQKAEVASVLDSACIANLAGVCLSSSYFLGMRWKASVIDVAAGFLPLDGEGLLRLQLRRLALARLSQDRPAQDLRRDVQSLISKYQVTNQRSNAWYGEMVLFHARLLVDIEQHQDALDVLASFRAWEVENVSWLERIIFRDMEFLKGQVARHRGDFSEALSIFQMVLKRSPTPHKVMTQITAIHCELGLFNRAFGLLFDDIPKLDTLGHLTGIRLLLALGEAYVMKAASMAAQQRHDIAAGRTSTELTLLIDKVRPLLLDLGSRFNDTNQLTKVGEMNRFRLLLASAMVEHLTGAPGEAITCWDMAQAASSRVD
ncbi:uncharacterized protein FTOL_06907 [Fusarium torulosum]|uniref:Uncharacterized protein n=1 Tax=Fusarium torulosum TaxID=33205 RepID=A0AAE8SII8_9HYPO|nr:uncharacterized protein FTOL_06907 [Fusarium torulosum]